jgi:hypothetical protein
LVHQIATDTRCSMGNAPDSVSSEPRAAQSSDSVRHEASAWTTMSSSNYSRMLFLTINLSSRQSAQGTIILSYDSNFEGHGFERLVGVYHKARAEPCQLHRPRHFMYPLST